VISEYIISVVDFWIFVFIAILVGATFGVGIGAGLVRRERRVTRYCRMTCDGGSERGECPCERPVDCEMKVRKP